MKRATALTPWPHLLVVCFEVSDVDSLVPFAVEKEQLLAMQLDLALKGIGGAAEYRLLLKLQLAPGKQYWGVTVALSLV